MAARLPPSPPGSRSKGMHRARHRIVCAIRPGLARLLAIVLGLAFVVGVLRGGSHYLYCPFMDEVLSEPCCSESHDGASAVETPDCCQTKEIGTLPSARAVAPLPEFPAAPLLAIIPPPHDMDAEASLARPRRFGIERTGPPLLARAERAARLMVFLI